MEKKGNPDRLPGRPEKTANPVGLRQALPLNK
jgi:hypothetical protein